MLKLMQKPGKYPNGERIELTDEQITIFNKLMYDIIDEILSKDGYPFSDVNAEKVFNIITTQHESEILKYFPLLNHSHAQPLEGRWISQIFKSFLITPVCGETFDIIFGPRERNFPQYNTINLKEGIRITIKGRNIIPSHIFDLENEYFLNLLITELEKQTMSLPEISKTIIALLKDRKELIKSMFHVLSILTKYKIKEDGSNIDSIVIHLGDLQRYLNKFTQYLEKINCYDFYGKKYIYYKLKNPLSDEVQTYQYNTSSNTSYGTLPMPENNNPNSPKPNYRPRP